MSDSPKILYDKNGQPNLLQFDGWLEPNPEYTCPIKEEKDKARKKWFEARTLARKQEQERIDKMSDDEKITYLEAWHKQHRKQKANQAD